MRERIAARLGEEPVVFYSAYESDEREIAVLANDRIRTPGDYHHQVLEGVKVFAECGDTKVVEFMMGS
jgi:hypothetical protein